MHIDLTGSSMDRVAHHQTIDTDLNPRNSTFFQSRVHKLVRSSQIVCDIAGDTRARLPPNNSDRKTDPANHRPSRRLLPDDRVPGAAEPV